MLKARKLWNFREKKKHQKKMQSLIETEGSNYILTPRPKKRGGGSAIMCNAKAFSMKKFILPNSDNLELTIGIVRPKYEAKDITIIVMALYCPPRSRKHNKLISYITDSYQYIKAIHP